MLSVVGLCAVDEVLSEVLGDEAILMLGVVEMGIVDAAKVVELDAIDEDVMELRVVDEGLVVGFLVTPLWC